MILSIPDISYPGSNNDKKEGEIFVVVLPTFLEVKIFKLFYFEQIKQKLEPMPIDTTTHDPEQVGTSSPQPSGADPGMTIHPGS
jgi:hypothetical protein